MERSHADILFVLGIYNEGINLDKLLFHIEPGSNLGNDERGRIKTTLTEMEENGLVSITNREGDFFVCITPLGYRVSAGIAEVLADNVVNNWLMRQPEIAAGGLKAANY